MLTQAFSYPLKGSSTVKTIIIGVILGSLSLLVLPWILLQGYTVRILRTAANNEERPVFNHWGRLFVDGVKAFVISVVYFLLPIVGFFAAGTAMAGGAGGSAQLGLTALAGVLLLVAVYLLPAAFTNFATSGRFTAAFAFGRLGQIVTSRAYAFGWLLALGVIIAVSFVLGIANGLFNIEFTGLLGGSTSLSGMAVASLAVYTVLLQVVGFYVAIVLNYIYGRSFGAAQAVKFASTDDVEEDQPAV